MHPLLQQIELLGLVPLVTIDNAADAVPLADALVQGGLPCVELTLRTPAALEAITRAAAAHPEMIVGAGTVLNVGQASAALDAGARWIISPGFDRRIVDFCRERDVAVTPGVQTATEIQSALDAHVDVVKFFPSDRAGGLEQLKALLGPFGAVRFLPTGVDEVNISSYLHTPGVIACGGAWVTRRELIAAKRFDEIRTGTAALVRGMLGLELRHVGLNMPDATSAAEAAGEFCRLLDLPLRETPEQIFVGTGIEVRKRPHLGAHGHLALQTPFIDRAVAWFDRRGYRIRPETRDVRDGRLHAVYLEEEIGGFALHLIQV